MQRSTNRSLHTRASRLRAITAQPLLACALAALPATAADASDRIRRRPDTSSSATAPTRGRSRIASAGRRRRGLLGRRCVSRSPTASRRELGSAAAHGASGCRSRSTTGSRAVQQGQVDLLCAPTSVTLAAAEGGRRSPSRSSPVAIGAVLRARRAASAARHPRRPQREPASRVARLAGGQACCEKQTFAVVTGTTTASVARGPAHSSLQVDADVVPVADYRRGHAGAAGRQGRRVLRGARRSARRDATMRRGRTSTVLDRLFTYEPLALGPRARRRRLPPRWWIAR